MGIFQKLKTGLSTGGVKVQIQAPAVHLADPTVPVTVVITAGDTPAQIKSIWVELVCRTWNLAARGQWSDETISEAQNNQTLMVGPGESKSVQISLVMNKAAAIGEQLGQGKAGSVVAQALGGLSAIGEAINPNKKTYLIQVSADVDGVGMNASASQDLQVLKPGEIGASTTISI